jgi:hypothetical protein
MKLPFLSTNAMEYTNICPFCYFFLFWGSAGCECVFWLTWSALIALGCSYWLNISERLIGHTTTKLDILANDRFRWSVALHCIQLRNWDGLASLFSVLMNWCDDDCSIKEFAEQTKKDRWVLFDILFFDRGWDRQFLDALFGSQLMENAFSQ